MNKILMQIIVDYVLFLQLCDEDQLNLDTAVRQTEQIAYRLQKLSRPEQVEFLEYVAELAAQAERGAGRDRRWQCLNDLPEALGLMASDD